MIPILISLGLFGGGGPVGDPLPTPPERIIKLSRSTGFTVATHVLDPTDELNYLIDLSALLEDGEAFTGVTLAVLPASAAVGFSIPATGAFAARNVDDRHIAIWPTIDAGQKNSAQWAGQGLVCSFEITGVTDTDPSRVWQRTAGVRVAQR